MPSTIRRGVSNAALLIPAVAFSSQGRRHCSKFSPTCSKVTQATTLHIKRLPRNFESDLSSQVNVTRHTLHKKRHLWVGSKETWAEVPSSFPRVAKRMLVQEFMQHYKWLDSTAVLTLRRVHDTTQIELLWIHFHFLCAAFQLKTQSQFSSCVDAPSNC